MAAKVVSRNSKLAGPSEAWPRTRQNRALEEWNSSGSEDSRLSALPAFLVWTMSSVLIWGGIIAAIALIR